jgi:hypothetical protein
MKNRVRVTLHCINDLGNYNPTFYAAEALIILYKALGLAGRVYRGYDRNPGDLGDTIKLRRPGTFTAKNAPDTATEIKPDSLSIQLDQWKEVRFNLTDQELAYTGQRIIAEHIDPAAYALADIIDQTLATLAFTVPWVVGTSGVTPFATTVNGFTDAWKQLAINKAPMRDLHFMLDPSAQANAFALQAFSQWQGAGPQGVETQQNATMGQKFGFEVFWNQNVKQHTAGTCSVTTLAIVGNTAKGATVIAVDAVSVTGTLVAGDILSIAGDSQKYAVTATATASGNAFATVSIFPPLSQDTLDNAVVTVTLNNRVCNLAFHRNFAALAMCPLPSFMDGQGVRVFTATDPITRLALRARTWADGTNSKFNICLDTLYGVAQLDANLAVVLMG